MNSKADKGSDGAPEKPKSKPARPARDARNVRQFTIAADDDGIRLDRWFHRHMPQISFNMVSRWARTGQLRLDGKRAKPGDALQVGQVLRIPPGSVESRSARSEKPRRELSEEETTFAHSMVLHRDRAALVINKPPGLATQGGTKTHMHVDLLCDALHFGEEARPRLVHRLDKDTSGVLLLARTPGSAAFFSKRFSGRSARKIYWALVVGVPEISAGLIDLPLAKQPGTGGEKMHVDHERGQPSRSAYQLIERAGNAASWLALQPLTGRTHQLRAHLAAIGHPIVGDGKYGGQEAFLTGSVSRKMHLHARSLRIGHPDGPPLEVVADLPEHFQATMAHMGFDPALGDHAFAEEVDDVPERTVRKKKARAHAKQQRKERRGERRRRGDIEPKKGRPGKPGKGAKPGKAGRSKPGGRGRKG